MPQYFRKDKDLRAVNDTMSLTMSRADYDLHSKDLSIVDAKPGHLHVHKNSGTDKLTAWMMLSADRWEDLGNRFPFGLDQEPFIRHPHHAKLVLTLGKAQEPSYILESSLKARIQKEKKK
jgi:hypothetical protein